MVKQKQFTVVQHSATRQDKNVSFESGKMAVQADSSIKVKVWDNEFLFSTCMEKSPDGGKDYMPLMIDFRESYSAAGRIAGALYRRRESRPPTWNILYARMTDRALRPMFPKGMVNDVIISVTPLALDHELELDVITIIGASMSVMAAGVPLDGPIWAVQIWYIDGKFLINPNKEELEKSLFNLLVAGKKWSINMIECGANEAPKDLLNEAFVLAQKEIDTICDIQSEFLAKLTIKKQEITKNKPSKELIAYISNILTPDKMEELTGHTKVPFNELFTAYKKEVLELAKENIADSENDDFSESKVNMWVFNVIKNFIRKRSLETGKRLDDRTEKEIRDLYCEVGLFKRTHGTGLFRRWDTQVLTTTTIGWPRDYLLYDDMENDRVKDRYFHHYNFPPFSVWEARPTRWQNRREIWHGMLAEKALKPMLPDQENFPQCVRTVSECLGSGGSTSMGSVCGSTLSLMDAGVPIKKPVAGIAMGLFAEHKDGDDITKYMVLNDLQWVEDFTGDMDFKVAGTKDWVTAIQLDTKLKWLTMEIVHETMNRAFVGYNEIMDFMLQTIDTPRTSLSEFAPKVFSIKVPEHKVKEVIWKWWEVINKIIEDAGWVKIDFEEDGTCFIAHHDQASIDKAIEMIEYIVKDLEVWEIYEWKIKRVEDYWVFVNLPKWKSWLCHVSKLGADFSGSIQSNFKEGNPMKVKIISVDDKGRINLQKI